MAFLKLILEVEFRCGKENVDPALFGAFNCVPCPVYRFVIGMAEGADSGVADFFRDEPYRVEITLGRNGETGFDYIYAKALKLPGYFELFLWVKARTGGLFAVPESSVKNENTFTFHYAPALKFFVCWRLFTAI
jgi:hypothetical protein